MKKQRSKSDVSSEVNYSNDLPILSDDPGTSWALWQLYLVLKEIAKESQRKEVEATLNKDT